MLLVTNGVIIEPVTELFRRHNRALYNFVAWLCRGDMAAAEDVTQRTWEKLMTRAGNYTPSASFRTYLFQIARNTWADTQTQSWSTQRSEWDEQSMAELPAGEPLPEAIQFVSEQGTMVREALMALPFLQREVVVLRYFGDMSLEEISQTVGAGFETVKSRLRYAFQSLRETLESIQ